MHQALVLCARRLYAGEVSTREEIDQEFLKMFLQSTSVPEVLKQQEIFLLLCSCMNVLSASADRHEHEIAALHAKLARAKKQYKKLNKKVARATKKK